MRRNSAPNTQRGGWFLPFLSDALLLSLLLAGTALCCQSLYGLVSDTRLLLLTAAGAGTLMAAIYALPRFRWAALLLWAEGCALGTWLLWDRLTVGASAVRFCLVMSLGGQSSPPDPFPVQAAALLLCAALVVFSLPLGWAALGLRWPWAVAALVYPLLLPGFLLDRLPPWPRLLLLLTPWAASLLTGVLPRRERQARARLTLAALPAAAGVLVLLTLALPRETYVYPAWAQEAKGVLLSGDLSFSLPDLLAGGIQIGGSGSRVDLAGAGPLSLSNRAMLRVETDVSGRIYLRGRSAGTYTGTAWEPLGEEAYETMGDLGGYEPLNFPALASRRDDWHAVKVELTGAPGNCLYVPYSLLTDADALSGGRFVDDSHIAKNFGLRYYILYYRPEAAPSFRMTGLTGTAAQAEAAYRAFVYDHYLEVPQAARDALWTWARESASRYDLEPSKDYREVVQVSYWVQMELVELIRTYLAATTTYDTDAPAMPEGADFLDYFLNESRRGYCMHYATAAALYLRMMGIPARYVSGYTVVLPASGRANVPESAAHAWVEIYLDGYGWYPVEVTPPYVGEETAAGGGEEEGPEETPAPTPTPTPPGRPPPLPSRPPPGDRGGPGRRRRPPGPT